jgi:hypothetical protein
LRFVVLIGAVAVLMLLIAPWQTFLNGLVGEVNGVEQPMTTFPTVQTQDLNGRRVTLPADLPGRATIVVVAYDQEDQPAVDTWVPFLSRLAEDVPDVGFVELPVVGETSWVGRRLLDFYMRQGIPDSGARARTITLYVDRQTFRDALGLPAESGIWLLLIDQEDQIAWRARGSFEEGAATSLEQAVEEVLGSR